MMPRKRSLQRSVSRICRRSMTLKNAVIADARRRASPAFDERSANGATEWRVAGSLRRRDDTLSEVGLIPDCRLPRDYSFEDPRVFFGTNPGMSVT